MPRKIVFLFVCSIILLTFLAACGSNFQDNSLGYNFVGTTMHNLPKRTITVPASNAKTIAGLRSYDIGLPPESFMKQYGQPLSPSEQPTQFWFKASLDDFPNGSVMIVGFDRSSVDNAPRANEISYVAGDLHPTTDTQAETIAESFLPNDEQGPTQINKYAESTRTCQSETYTSATLASLFPAQDFLDATGKPAKVGTITLSLFPHYPRQVSTSDGTSYETNSNGDAPDQPNAVSSFLLTLGTKPYC